CLLVGSHAGFSRRGPRWGGSRTLGARIVTGQEPRLPKSSPAVVLHPVPDSGIFQWRVRGRTVISEGAAWRLGCGRSTYEWSRMAVTAACSLVARCEVPSS